MRQQYQISPVGKLLELPLPLHFVAQRQHLQHLAAHGPLMRRYKNEVLPPKISLSFLTLWDLQSLAFRRTTAKEA